MSTETRTHGIGEAAGAARGEAGAARSRPDQKFVWEGSRRRVREGEREDGGEVAGRCGRGHGEGRARAGGAVERRARFFFR